VNIRAAMSLISQSIPSSRFCPATALHHTICQWWVLIDSSSSIYNMKHGLFHTISAQNKEMWGKSVQLLNYISHSKKHTTLLTTTSSKVSDGKRGICLCLQCIFFKFPLHWTFDWQHTEGDNSEKQAKHKSTKTPSSTVLEKLTASKLVKKFYTFYETQRFITMFTRVYHWTLFWAAWLNSTSSDI